MNIKRVCAHMGTEQTNNATEFYSYLYERERAGAEALSERLTYASDTPVPPTPRTPHTPKKRTSMPIYMMLRKF